jgi:hypothetical protein
MMRGAVNDAIVSASSERNFPSQPKRKFNVALRMVGVLSGRFEPSSPSSCSLLPAPLMLRSWQDEQLRELSCERRGSLNRRSPSLAFNGSAATGSGIGVMGSSTAVLSSSNGSSCGRAGECCKPQRISTQDQRARPARTAEVGLALWKADN